MLLENGAFDVFVDIVDGHFEHFAAVFCNFLHGLVKMSHTIYSHRLGY